MIVALQVVLLLLISGSLIFYWWCAICTIRFFAPVKRQTDTINIAASLLVPVCGLDEGAKENWTALCQQNYESYEVLFGVMSAIDPAVPTLQELVAKFPNRARFVLCQPVRGINYQVSNLMHLVEAAAHEVVIFVDSDMSVTPEYLSTVIAPLANPAVGVVTCPYVGHQPKSIGAALASLGRCIDFIPSVLVARSLDGKVQFALGATIATRKSVLTEIGGLQGVVDRVGADYQIGKRASDAGYKVELSQYVLENDAGAETWRQVFNRELRWAKSIRSNRGIQYYGIGCCYGTIYCIPLLVLSGWQSWAIILCLTTIASRVILALIAIVSINCPNLRRWLWLLPLRDLMSFIVWVGGILGQGIYWRGRWLSIGPGGILQEQGSKANKWGQAG